MLKKSQAVVIVQVAFWALSGCNANSNSSLQEAQLWPGGCSVAQRATHIEVIGSTKKALPARVSIMVDGVVKWDECLPEPQIPTSPRVIFERQAKGFRLFVDLAELTTTPANQTSLKIYDRNDCRSLERIFFSALNVPLQYKPEGTDSECGGEVSATVVLTQENSTEKNEPPELQNPQVLQHLFFMSQ